MKLRWEIANGYKHGYINNICCAAVVREHGAYRYFLFNRIQPVSEGTEHDAMMMAERALQNWMEQSLKEMKG